MTDYELELARIVLENIKPEIQKRLAPVVQTAGRMPQEDAELVLRSMVSAAESILDELDTDYDRSAPILAFLAAVGHLLQAIHGTDTESEAT